jgi:hypothetical protein
MTAALILCISLAALLQFFVSYCHWVIAESRGSELSEQALEVAGISNGIVNGEQRRRLLGLIALFPESGGDRSHVRAVKAYFNLLELAWRLTGWFVPTAARWIESERSGCGYAAAVMLDRRIAYNRGLAAYQLRSQL